MGVVRSVLWAPARYLNNLFPWAAFTLLPRRGARVWYSLDANVDTPVPEYKVETLYSLSISS